MQRGFSNIADISAKLFRFWDGDAAASGDSLQSQGEGKAPKFATPGGGVENIEVLDKSNTQVAAINTTSPVDLVTVTVPANSMPGAQSGEGFRAYFGCLIFNASGGPINATFRLRFAGANAAVYDAWNPIADTSPIGFSHFLQIFWLATRQSSVLASRTWIDFSPAGAGIGGSDDYTPTHFANYNNGSAVSGGFGIDQDIVLQAEMSVADPLANMLVRPRLIESFF